MKIQRRGANVTIFQLGNGTELLVSYQTPVAAFVPGKGYLRTVKRWSSTTSKHISQYLGGHTAQTAPQEYFDSFMERVR